MYPVVWRHHGVCPAFSAKQALHFFKEKTRHRCDSSSSVPTDTIMEFSIPVNHDANHDEMDMEALRHVLSKDEEMAAIREALSRDYTPPVSPSNSLDQEDEDNDDDNSPKEEVNYHEGATPLFLAVETTDWRRALHIVQASPNQARTWVSSLGTVETTFNWALWRRLPIHEACRREAPAWLISALLSTFPESSKSATQFGELPLHLAVECGAPPEVVNLLVAAHWLGITAVDQSGRTPLEILNDTEMLAMEDHKVVFDSLTRSQQTYDEIIKRHETEVDVMQRDHAKGLVGIRQEHDGDLQLEQEQQDNLVNEVDRLKELLAAAKKSNQIQQSKMDAVNAAETSWRDNNQMMKKRVSDLELRNQQEMDRVRSLEQVIELKDHEISLMEGRVHELSADLQIIAAWQQKELVRSLDGTEQRIHDMVESYVSLRSQLDDQAGDMRTLLKERGIYLPSPEAKEVDKTEKPSSVDETTDISESEEDDLDDEFDVMSAAQAAKNALQLS
jgi:hypothetical protein